MNSAKTLKSKKEQPQGFTIIEVTLFLALTGLVLAGIIMTFSSVSRQRYSDSVQNFAEYLRDLYSQTENIQNNGNNCQCEKSRKNTCCGQGKTAFYGKIVTFDTNSKDPNGQTIKSYDVIGNAHLGTNLVDDTKQLLRNDIKISFISGDRGVEYKPVWQAIAQRPDRKVFTGSILIVRSPYSGIIHTYYRDQAVTPSSGVNLTDWLNGANNTSDTNLCIYSDELVSSRGERRNIRIAKDAHNASGVKLIASNLPSWEGGSVCGS